MKNQTSCWWRKVMHLPQRNLRNCWHPNIRESFFRVVVCRREVNMELDHVERIMLEDLVAGTASFLWINVFLIINTALWLTINSLISELASDICVFTYLMNEKRWIYNLILNFQCSLSFSFRMMETLRHLIIFSRHIWHIHGISTLLSTCFIDTKKAFLAALS